MANGVGSLAFEIMPSITMIRIMLSSSSDSCFIMVFPGLYAVIFIISKIFSFFIYDSLERYSVFSRDFLIKFLNVTLKMSFPSCFTSISLDKMRQLVFSSTDTVVCLFML